MRRGSIRTGPANALQPILPSFDEVPRKGLSQQDDNRPASNSKVV